MEYYKTKDILHVQERLGHRSITSTMIYTHLINFESDEYRTATSKNLKEDETFSKQGSSMSQNETESKSTANESELLAASAASIHV